MGCNCNKTKAATKATPPPPPPTPVPAKGTTQSFALIRTDGTTEHFGSRLEADARRVRLGGGQVRPL